jgi:ABC-2 type transport system ATP-binding protein
MTASEPAIAVSGVSRRFGTTQALNNVTFSVAPAELFGIVGPDGGGKTTLFRILATLLLPDAGTAWVLGRDVVQELWELRQRLGYMPGRFSLYGDLSVEENLAFFASVFGTSLDAGRDIIAPIYAQLEPFRTRRAAALSGGMKQKLALCCALVHRPELLLLDEPTTGVDAVSRREFWDLLGELRAGGLTIIVSTPYMDEAARCDRIALMQGGRMLAIDAPAQIGARYPRPLFAVSGQPRHRLLGALRSLPHVASAFAFGDTVHYSDARAQVDTAIAIEEVQRGLLAGGVSDVRVQSISPGIEDVFIELMGTAPAAAAA